MLDKTSTATLAARPAVPFIYLMLIEGRCLASNVRGEVGINSRNQWSWIVGNIVGEFGCDPEAVTCLETDEGDMIAVNGKPAAVVIYE